MEIRNVKYGVIEVTEDEFSKFRGLGFVHKYWNEYYILIFPGNAAIARAQHKRDQYELASEQYQKIPDEVIEIITKASDEGYDMLLIRRKNGG